MVDGGTEQASPFDEKGFLRTLTSRPGVYRMYGADGEVLYVGKARNLKKRVSSYFRANLPSLRTQALMVQMRRIEVTVTHTENEALLLENHLIKEHQPHYNILLRDDKGYPYIFLSTGEDFPRLSFHRGARQAKGRYFGPYPSASAVRESLNLLQKLFPVRQCEDNFFRNRSRPCLQYQIKRCTAPCVELVTPAEYQKDVRHAVMFLDGQSNAVIDELVGHMEAASAGLEFERAAGYRDQIASLRRLQEKQYISTEAGDVDVIAAAVQGGTACVQVFFIRGGRNLGNKTLFPQHADGCSSADILSAFIPQYYVGASEHSRDLPAEIILSHALEDAALLEGALSELAGRRVSLSHSVRGDRARWLRMAESNVDVTLTARLSSRASMLRRFESLQEALGLDGVPQRLECFDVSHMMGEATVASCVVFDTQGALKSDYRRFNISDATPGDDYAAMRQALSRRYTRLKKGEGALPDVLFIDGGKGQLGEAAGVLQDLQVTGVTLVGIAKGPERRPGLETLFLYGSDEPLILKPDSVALHLIQQVRDEAHRFAVAGHRQRRTRVRTTSVLEEVPGLGPKRRQQLLKQFGGLQEVARAGVEDLAKVSGISRDLARRIYETFHLEA